MTQTTTPPASPKKMAFRSGLIPALVCLLSAITGRASTKVFVTAPGANVLGAGVSDRVTFITSLNQVDIQVQNLSLNIDHEIQALAAMDWLPLNLDNSVVGQPISGALLTSGEANLGSLTDFSGPDMDAMAALSSNTNRWAIYASTQITGGTELLWSAGTRSQLLPGPLDLETPDSAVMSYRIAYGANSHVTADTVITQVHLTFGTSFDYSTDGLNALTDTPEPGTIALSLTGIALIIVGRLRRRGPPRS
jgi:hypothetical protein